MRDLPTGMAANTEAGVFRAIFLVKISWSTGVIYAWTGYGSITVFGYTFLGTGHLGTVSGFEESADLRANGCQLTLSGIPSERIAEASTRNSQGRPADVWVGSMNEYGVFEADPYRIFSGFIDIAPIEDDGKTCTISLSLEKELKDKRARNSRFTHEDQQRIAPGDMIFQYAAVLSTKEFPWGSKIAAAATSSPSSNTGVNSNSSNQQYLE